MSAMDRHLRASELFLIIRRLPVEQRTAQLDALTNSDAELREAVVELLAHDVPDDADVQRTPTASRGNGSAPTLGSLPMGAIGPYRIISRIGSGGSGHVFLAEQDTPIHRRVAIKVVPQAAVNEELAARFDVERRALEAAEHPHIARVLDAGRTPDGLPYLVMDYVEGEPITDYCNNHHLRLAQRIALMLDVADAIQHAHQRGIIHRDIKPANILITDVNGKPAPRVLDFGIAKPISGMIAEQSPPTAGLPLGTPAYMAPEQTGLQPADTRADVYALGAVLYELVAGRPPIETKADPLDMLKRVREHIPEPASRVRAENAARFHFEHVPRSIRNDLDVILTCALEKSPDRRYATVGALADDLRRMLRIEPIQARQPTLRYRTARFMRRNRILVTAAVAIALVANAAAILITLSLIEANRQRLEAVSQTEAQREINRFLTDDLLAAASPDDQGKDVTALVLLERASSKVDDRFPDRPAIAAAIHHTLGDAFAVLGAFDQAEYHLSKALEMRRVTTGMDSEDTVHSEIAYASLLARRDKLDDAERALLAAVTRARLVLNPADPALYTALNDLGVVFDTLGKHQDAVNVLMEARQGRERLLGRNDPKVFITISNLALATSHLGDTEKSIELMKEALRVAEAQPEPSKLVLVGLNNNIGATYQDLDRDDEAAPYIRKASQLALEFLGPGHPATLTIQGNLAGLEAELGDPERGAEIYSKIVKERTFLLGKTAHDTLTARYGYWNCLWLAKRFDEAAQGYAELLADMTPVLGENNWFTVQTKASLARAMHDAGHSEEALPLAQRALEQFMELYGPENNRTQSTRNTVELIRKRLGE